MDDPTGPITIGVVLVALAVGAVVMYGISRGEDKSTATATGTMDILVKGFVYVVCAIFLGAVAIGLFAVVWAAIFGAGHAVGKAVGFE